MGVVFTENDKAVIVEAPLDDAIKSADGVSKGSGKVTIYVFHPRSPMSIHTVSLLTRYHFNVLKVKSLIRRRSLRCLRS